MAYEPHISLEHSRSHAQPLIFLRTCDDDDGGRKGQQARRPDETEEPPLARHSGNPIWVVKKLRYTSKDCSDYQI